MKLVEGKGKLAGARIVRDGYAVMLISDGGTVIRMAVDDIKRLGRATQGVIVMRLREGEQVSSLAPVIAADEEDVEDDDSHADDRLCPRTRWRTPDSPRDAWSRTRRTTTSRRASRMLPRRRRRRQSRSAPPRDATVPASSLTYVADRSAAFESAVRMSIGIGKTMVELFDEPISSSVCR